MAKKKARTSRTGRFFKLAGMTATVAGQYAGERVKSIFSDEEKVTERKSKTYEKMANEITETLGDLKGAVMKVGQIASQTQDFLPKEFSEALQKLQQEAPPVDFEVIEQQIIDELGEHPDKLFQSFEREPYAAASIGQVHKAFTLEGEEVIVKVQYPGVDRSCDSDLKQLKLTLKLGGLLKLPKESVDALFEEVRDRLHEELDYENEATNAELFRQFHARHDFVVVPQVIKQLSTRRVLTLSCHEGVPASKLREQDFSQEAIDQLGYNLFTLLSDQLFELQIIHGDPHAGNFAFRADGTIIIYDFGCVKKLAPGIVDAYKSAIQGSLLENYEQVDDALLNIGARVEDKATPGADYYKVWRNIFFPPFLYDEPFDFEKADIHLQVAKEMPLFFKHMERFKPPVESLFIDRMLAGHYWIMKAMGVRASFKSDVARHISL